MWPNPEAYVFELNSAADSNAVSLHRHVERRRRSATFHPHRVGERAARHGDVNHELWDALADAHPLEIADFELPRFAVFVREIRTG